jgi:hypothetical protein
MEMFIRVRQFETDNAADFPAGSVGATQFGVINTEIGVLEDLSGEQAASTGDTRQGFVQKETARENLREALYEIVRTARDEISIRRH